MDLMTGGELFDRIVMKDHYSEREAKDALYQIVIAIQYCHSRNIVHRYKNNFTMQLLYFTLYYAGI